MGFKLYLSALLCAATCASAVNGVRYKGETVNLKNIENGVYYLRVQGEAARRIGIRK